MSKSELRNAAQKGEPDVIKRLRDGESMHDNPNFTEADGGEIIEYISRTQEAYRQRTEELQSRLAGAITALKDIKECVPPKDWKPYGQAVLDYAARIDAELKGA